jgi:Ca2+/Na+ antiporter
MVGWGRRQQLQRSHRLGRLLGSAFVVLVICCGLVLVVSAVRQRRAQELRT